MGLFSRKDKGDKTPKSPNFAKSPAADRAIVFYAEDGGSWPHFEPIVHELTGSLGHTVSYVTSSATDPVLATTNPNLRPFVVPEGLKRTFMFQMLEAGVLVATMPRLGHPVFPRSKQAANAGLRYVYVFHSMVSTHMIYDADAFDGFDTILTVGDFQTAEIRAREAQAGLREKALVAHGYGRLDAIIAAADHAARPPNDPVVVLVAPSWGPHCLFETCGADLIQVLLDAGLQVIARPHPMTQRETPAALQSLRTRFGTHERFEYDEAIASQEALHRCDVMVSDWSGAALEFAFGLEKPVLFVDVERKVNNPQWTELGIEPFEATVREQIGRVVARDQLAAAPALVRELVADPGAFRAQIRAVRDGAIHNVGRSGAVAAAVIAQQAAPYLARFGR